jgi:hypothetical protein
VHAEVEADADVGEEDPKLEDNSEVGDCLAGGAEN